MSEGLRRIISETELREVVEQGKLLFANQPICILPSIKELLDALDIHEGQSLFIYMQLLQACFYYFDLEEKDEELRDDVMFTCHMVGQYVHRIWKCLSFREDFERNKYHLKNVVSDCENRLLLALSVI